MSTSNIDPARQACAYHHASDLPKVVWRALLQHEAVANVILPFAKKAINSPRDSDQLWIVVYDANNVEFVLSCTKGPIDNYPIFIIACKSSTQLAQEERRGRPITDALSPLIMCLLNEVPPQRVFSVFSTVKVTTAFAKLFEAYTHEKHGIQAIKAPYYDATFTFCTRETLKKPPADAVSSFTGQEEIAIALLRADMSHLGAIAAMCKAFSETSVSPTSCLRCSCADCIVLFCNASRRLSLMMPAQSWKHGR